MYTQFTHERCLGRYPQSAVTIAAFANIIQLRWYKPFLGFISPNLSCAATSILIFIHYYSQFRGTWLHIIAHGREALSHLRLSPTIIYDFFQSTLFACILSQPKIYKDNITYKRLESLPQVDTQNDTPSDNHVWRAPSCERVTQMKCALARRLSGSP